MNLEAPNFVQKISDRCTPLTEIEQSTSSQQRARRYQPKSVNHCRLKKKMNLKPKFDVKRSAMQLYDEKSTAKTFTEKEKDPEKDRL